MSMLFILNFFEISLRIKALLLASGCLKEAGTEYQKDMDSMASGWKGSSGTSFAEAAERVKAGFYVNGFVLERMINDVTTSQSFMKEQDALAASKVDAMADLLLSSE